MIESPLLFGFSLAGIVVFGTLMTNAGNVLFWLVLLVFSVFMLACSIDVADDRPVRGEERKDLDNDLGASD